MDGQRILIVDDSRLSLQLMSALLADQRADLQIETENHPGTAMQRAMNEEFALLMLDLNMPEVSGEELAAQLRSAGREVPICFVTANVQNPVRERLEQQFGPVFSKPVTEKLARAVLAYLDQCYAC